MVRRIKGVDVQQARKEEPPGTSAIRRYFEGVYPRRTAGAGPRLFRRGEEERVRAIRELLSDCRGSVLDAGCGDGAVIEAVLPPGVEFVRVEDLVPARVSEAVGRLERGGRIVQGAVRDVTLPSASGARFDAVLAIGIMDYNPDWEAIIPRLLGRTSGLLVVDFPRTGWVGGWARRIWLGRYGLRCRFATLEELEALLQVPGHQVLLKPLAYNWLAAIRKAPSPTPGASLQPLIH